ncbi:MAG: hypothetical protein EXS14_08070 [Planctomycetes bacterium]|nr:hypothetical protein [Planctomycetota bacterium]
MREDPLARVVGHAEACTFFRAMLRRGRVPNGIVITGPEGSGRRTLALAFAEALMFGDSEGLVDSADRAAWRARQGLHPDLMLLQREQGKRQLGIDHVRALRSEFSMKPLEASRRVAIVVDAERLTEEAANALLKLLEEPPEGSHLLLTASALGALMETLVSRCVRVRLGPLDRGVLSAFLAREGFSGVSADLAALAAQGAPGRALGLARADFAGQLAPAVRLLEARSAPFLAAQEIYPTLEQDKKQMEDTRERLRQLLRAALFLLRLRRRTLEGLETPAGLPTSAGLESMDAVEIDRRSAELLQALQAVDSNVAAQTVLTHVAMGGRVSVGVVRGF